MMYRHLLGAFLAAPVLSSCMVSHQIFYERAFQSDGISIKEPTAYYRHGGKLYVQGQRAAMRYTRRSPWMDMKEAILGPSHWQYATIPGSEYGPILYHEVTRNMEYAPQLYLRDDSSWQALSLPTTQRGFVRIGVRPHIPDDKTRRMNWHATYALPAAVVSAIAVDLPITLAYYVSVPLVFAGELIFYFNQQANVITPPER